MAAVSSTRLTPRAPGEGSRASAGAAPARLNLTPSIDARCAGSIKSSTPIRSSANTAGGIRHSPQALSGGEAPRSSTSALKPWSRAAIATASPAGPPPAISTSQSRAEVIVSRTHGEDDWLRTRAVCARLNPAAPVNAGNCFDCHRAHHSILLFCIVNAWVWQSAKPT